MNDIDWTKKTHPSGRSVLMQYICLLVYWKSIKMYSFDETVSIYATRIKGVNTFCSLIDHIIQLEILFLSRTNCLATLVIHISLSKNILDHVIVYFTL